MESVDAPLACPVCFRPLTPSLAASALRCSCCGLDYPTLGGFADLRVGASAAGLGAYGSAPRPVATTLFESPLVAGAYERGWRASFAWAGFPGEDAEYEQAQRWLAPSAAERVLLDASCGSGLFTRRFAASGAFGRVVGLDFSEAMLTQARRDAAVLRVCSNGSPF